MRADPEEGIRWFAYVPHHLIEDYLLLGWVMVPTNGVSANFHTYQVTMEWICTECDLRTLKKEHR